MLSNTLKKTVPFISIEKLNKNYSSYTILDTREPKEYKVSHLKSSIFISYEDFDINKTIQTLPKNKPIVVYCSIGYRSEKIGELLIKKGYTVYNLYGGIFNWINKNQLVVTDFNTPTNNIHPYNKKWAVWLTKGIKIYE